MPLGTLKLLTDGTVIQAIVILDEDGNIINGTGGGGGGGDATADNQEIQINQLAGVLNLLGATLSIEAASLPLPTGAATQVTLASILTALGGTLTINLPAGASTEATLAAMSGKLPATLGQKTAANSMSVVLSSDGPFATNFGTTTDTAATTDTGTFSFLSFVKRLMTKQSSLVSGIPQPTTVTIVSLQTNATGTTYNAFSSLSCQALEIVNTALTAVDLEVRRGSSGNTIVVPSGSARTFIGITNASDLQVRRLDVSNTQVTFTGEAFAQ